MVRLSWLWRSECQMYCWAKYPWVFFVSFGVTLDSAETPFAKTPLSWFLTWVGSACVDSPGFLVAVAAGGPAPCFI